MEKKFYEEAALMQANIAQNLLDGCVHPEAPEVRAKLATAYALLALYYQREAEAAD